MRSALVVLVTAWLVSIPPPAGAATDTRPQPSVEAFGSGNLELVVVPERPCRELAPARLTVELFEEAAASQRLVRTFTLDNPCAAWEGDFTPLPNLDFSSIRHFGGTPSIGLEGRGKRPPTVRWPIRISRNGALIVEDTLVLDIERQRRRVYSGRKAFRIHCVRKHRPIKTKRGRRYCLRPVTVRNLRYEGQQAG